MKQKFLDVENKLQNFHSNDSKRTQLSKDMYLSEEGRDIRVWSKFLNRLMRVLSWGGDHLGLSPFAKTISNNTQQTPDNVMIFCFPYPSSGKNNWWVFKILSTGSYKLLFCTRVNFNQWRHKFKQEIYVYLWKKPSLLYQRATWWHSR